MNPPSAPKSRAKNVAGPGPDAGPAFGCPREFLGNRFVYTTISSRARGLSVGVNVNPDRQCNFDCVYCEVDRSGPLGETRLDLPVMLDELEHTLSQIRSGEIRRQPCFQRLPPELLELRHVALSGDGEPTLSPDFAAAVEAAVHLRAGGRFPFFKLVLITNASGLPRPEVVQALARFTSRDEIWVKLEAGTQAYADRVNRPDRPLEIILSDILSVARERPVVIQSLFPSLDGEGPPAAEIEAYAQRLRELKEAGAQIPLVQIYSATRPPTQAECGHLPLRMLSHIARRVHEVSGLKAEVF